MLCLTTLYFIYNYITLCTYLFFILCITQAILEWLDHLSALSIVRVYIAWCHKIIFYLIIFQNIHTRLHTNTHIHTHARTHARTHIFTQLLLIIKTFCIWTWYLLWFNYYVLHIAININSIVAASSFARVYIIFHYKLGEIAHPFHSTSSDDYWLLGSTILPQRFKFNTWAIEIASP